MMTSKLELTTITEWAERQRKNYINLEKEFANLNAKHPYERSNNHAQNVS